MLFIDDRQAEGMELNVVFNERVRAHDDADAAILEAGMYLPALLLGATARKQGAAHASRCKILADIYIVLLCKHFGGCHNAGLIAIIYCQQGAQNGHHSLSGTHISLKEAVHLMPALHIAVNLADDALLRPG